MNFDLAESRSILARTPAVLSALLEGLDENWVDWREREGEWSPREVVAHLIHGEKTDWIPRVRHLLAHGTAVPFTSFDRHAHLGDAAHRPLKELLLEFVQLRATSLAALDGIGRDGLPLHRLGAHPELGVVTLQQLLATWTAHDLGHIVQIARTMARRYAADVGPWREYLSLLRNG